MRLSVESNLPHADYRILYSKNGGKEITVAVLRDKFTGNLALIHQNLGQTLKRYATDMFFTINENVI